MHEKPLPAQSGQIPPDKQQLSAARIPKRKPLPSCAPVRQLKPLARYRVVFCGRFSGYTHWKLKSLFVSFGALVADSVSGLVTHIVCSEKSLRSKTVCDAKRLRKPLVTETWIKEVEKLSDGRGRDVNVNPNDYLWSGDSAEEEEQDGSVSSQ